MSDDTGPKSGYELAMERLRKQDEAAGIVRHVVTPAQKAAIAEIRSFYDAKLAQLEILHQGQLHSLFDSARREMIEDTYRRDRERLTAERDGKIEKARRDVPPVG